VQTKNLKQLFDIYTKQLRASGLDDPKSDLELIFSHVLGTSKSKLRFFEEITAKQTRKIDKLVKKRKKHIPVQYLIKNVEFMNLKLYVNKKVLIPRNETEQLADMIIKNINLIGEKQDQIKVLDMCCGSGAIGLSIAKDTKSFVDLVDISKSALKIAKKNAKLNNIENVGFMQSDLFKKVACKYDIFVSNPPYIKSNEISKLEKQVNSFEPLLALDGGESGFDFYEKIIFSLNQFLNSEASVFFEVGIGQAEQVASYLKQCDFKQIEIVNDYYGIERIVKAKF
jgi:release factor glutamine methyltransferase